MGDPYLPENGESPSIEALEGNTRKFVIWRRLASPDDPWWCDVSASSDRTGSGRRANPVEPAKV